MKLSQILQAIHNKTQESRQFMQAPSGTRFEEEISAALRKEGTYVNVSKTIWKRNQFHKEIKSNILSPDEKMELLNVPGLNEDLGYGNDRVLIHQPHGANNYPDFLLIYNDFVLPLEIKYSKERGNTPTWNSGYPRSKAIYIFGSYGQQDITAFDGDDYMSEDERKLMLQISKYTTEFKENKVIQEGYNKEKFDIYIRPMYNQKFSSLEFHERAKSELNVIALSTKYDF